MVSILVTLITNKICLYDISVPVNRRPNEAHGRDNGRLSRRPRPKKQSESPRGLGMPARFEPQRTLQ